MQLWKAQQLAAYWYDQGFMTSYRIAEEKNPLRKSLYLCGKHHYTNFKSMYFPQGKVKVL